MSRFSGLTKSAVWVAAGLIIGAGAGAGIGFLIVSLNEQNTNYSYGKPQSDLMRNSSLPIDIREHESGDVERQSIFGNFIEPSGVKETWKGSKIYEKANANETNINVVELGLKVLSYKLQHRLGFGPEVSILKNITISPDGAWDEANGVFLGSSNQIFINSSNIIAMLNQAKSLLNGFSSKEEEIEYIAEFVFQIIAHEYNHHMAYIYLNSRTNELKTTHPNLFKDSATYVDVKGSNPDLTEAWDTDFYNTFVKTLNYDNSDRAKSQKFMQSYIDGDFQQSYKEVGYGNGDFAKNGNDYNYVGKGKGNYIKNEPISKYFTAGDIFKYANNKNVKNISHGSTVWDDSKVYSFYRLDQPATYYTQEELAYHYSLAELYARKVQQMTMPTSIDYSDTLDENGNVIESYPLPKFRNLKIFPQWVPSANDPRVGRIISRFYKEVDKNNTPIWKDDKNTPFSYDMIGYDQLIWNQNGRGSYSPFLLDTKNYADDIYSVPFTSDYLYKQEASGSYDSTNAYAIYDAILQEMGYSGENVKNNHGITDGTMQSDISEIWWENKGEADKNGEVLVAGKTDSFKMGGYINDADYQYIGYMDDNNNFVSHDISVNAFTYSIKKNGLNDARDASYNALKDKYFWTLDKFQNINDFKGKGLYFGMNKSTMLDRLDKELKALDAQIAKETDATIKTQLEDKQKAKTKEIADTKALNSSIITFPVTSYNSEATTWLSLNSLQPQSGINSHIAYPTYNISNFEIMLEVE